MRARAYKNKGVQFYSAELKDRQVVYRLNPERELNQLPIVEDYILLKDYAGARKWIEEHRDGIREHDERTMFSFFEVVCDILQMRDYTSNMNKLVAELARNPLSAKFANRIWQWNYLQDFVVQNPFPEPTKLAITKLINKMKETAQ